MQVPSVTLPVSLTFPGLLVPLTRMVLRCLEDPYLIISMALARAGCIRIGDVVPSEVSG